MAWDNIISRGIWLFIQPSNFLFIVLIIGLILTIRSNKKKLGKTITSLALSVMFLAGFTNLSSWLFFPLEGRFSEYTNRTDQGPYQGIIVLSGSEKSAISTAHNQATLNHGGERLIAAATLSRLFPDLPIIHSGGARSSANSWTENDVAKKFFDDVGVDVSKVRFDGKSYNTHTNAIQSKKLIRQNENGTWLLVTSAFHMPRAVGAFRRSGINIQPYPVDYKTTLQFEGLFSLNFAENMFLFDLAIHEYIGLITYYVTGCSNALFPAKL